MSFREPDELSAYLASLDLQPYAQYLHAQDIHSLADLRLLTADDLAGSGLTGPSAWPRPAPRSSPRRRSRQSTAR